MTRRSKALVGIVILSILLTACAKEGTPATITIIGDGNIVTGESAYILEEVDSEPIIYHATQGEDVSIRFECEDCGYNEIFSADEIAGNIIQCDCGSDGHDEYQKKYARPIVAYDK